MSAERESFDAPPGDIQEHDVIRLLLAQVHQAVASKLEIIGRVSEQLARLCEESEQLLERGEINEVVDAVYGPDADDPRTPLPHADRRRTELVKTLKLIVRDIGTNTSDIEAWGHIAEHLDAYWKSFPSRD